MDSNPRNFKGDDRPVEQVSWDDCQDFIQKLNALGAGGRFRLPSEAEWEYACRAGSTTRFCFGDSDSGLDAYAWYSGNSGSQTHAVRQKRPNAWGLYDMHGNVWEWCEDWYHDSYTGASRDGSAWITPVGAYRVLRGGRFLSAPVRCRSAGRAYASPGRPPRQHRVACCADSLRWVYAVVFTLLRAPRVRARAKF